MKGTRECILLASISHLYIGCLAVWRMGTELVRHCVKEEDMDISSIPPGFESLAPFTLRKVDNNRLMINQPSSVSESKSHGSQVETYIEGTEDGKMIKSLRRKPGINYGKYEKSSEDESEPDQVE